MRKMLPILRMPKLTVATGMGKTKIYELISKNNFPKPIRLGSDRAVGWLESEIEEWLQERANERNLNLSKKIKQCTENLEEKFTESVENYKQNNKTKLMGRKMKITSLKSKSR